jgi:hypothetical protein
MPSRRDFIRLAGLTIGALASLQARTTLASGRSSLSPNDIDWSDETLSFNEVYKNPPLLGRVHGAARLRVLAQPSPLSKTLRAVYWSYVGPIYRAVHGERYDGRSQSTVWFETDGGYIHSAFFVPCHEFLQEPGEVPPEGFWGEVAAPLSYQHSKPSFASFKYDYSY